MKSLTIRSKHYQYLLYSFQEYLQILGYASPTVNSLPIHVRELLHYLEGRNILHITTIEAIHVDDFISHIKQRGSKVRAGALSSSSINKMITAINLFARFLNSTGKYILDLSTHRAEDDTGERSIYTIAEVKQLYEATFLPHRENPIAIGQRDRAIIAVLYGCGLRRSEAKQLNVADINLDRQLLFVRKGKGNKQRYVPIATKHFQDIKDYLLEGREWFLQSHQSNWHQVRHGKPYEKKTLADDAAFFISQKGNRMQEFYQRLSIMAERAELDKLITPHALRHSIATHLLQSGMDIDEIAKFLGHASLESTQIYTHIINQSNGDG